MIRTFCKNNAREFQLGRFFTAFILISIDLYALDPAADLSVILGYLCVAFLAGLKARHNYNIGLSVLLKRTDKTKPRVIGKARFHPYRFGAVVPAVFIEQII